MSFSVNAEITPSPEQPANTEIRDGSVETGPDRLIPGKSSGVEKVNNGVMTGENSVAAFSFHIPSEGIYKIKIIYTTVEGKGAAIERGISIDGAVPDPDFSSILLSRTFQDSDEGAVIDSGGNEYHPEQVEVFQTLEQEVMDSKGYLDGALQVHLSEGDHEISLTSIREPVIINRIIFCREEEIPTYDLMKKTYEAKGYQKVSGNSTVMLEAENALLKSSPTLYSFNDRTSSLTSPNDVSKIKLNAIGGYNWRYRHQWISWKIQVTESGLYEICMRYKQNFNEGQSSARCLSIDGKIPFQEARNITFAFDNDWQMKTLGDADPFLFYFESGKTYTMSLQNILGDYSALLSKSEECVLALNDIYLQFNMIVGGIADLNRDYAIDKQLPSCMKSLEKQSAALKEIAGRTEKLTGGKGDGYAAYQRLFVQIDSFLRNPDTIPSRLPGFSTNISSLADYILRASEQPLTLDYILIRSPEETLPRVNDTWIEKITFEIKAFFTSFFSDYNLVGKSGAEKNIDLWLTSGRDQAQVIKQMIDSGFSKDTGIGVNVRLVSGDVILPAAASGEGPDVAVGQEKSLPVKYGLRKALYDLSQFKDLPEVLSSFSESAYVPFCVGDHVYAIPDSQNFLLMYLRDDILSKLGISAPETWKELYSGIYDLHQNNMDIGLPNITEDNLEMFYALLFQHGGALFTKDLDRTRLDEEDGIAAFEEWSRLYTKYKITEQMNHLTRFRTGEAPIVISNLSFYNILSISAPEIKGLWSVSAIPGIRMENGTINRSCGSTPTGTVIFKNVRDSEACWKFVKWWTSDTVQAKYSREMENVQGASGRVISANLKAFNALSWPVKDLQIMNEQRKSIVSVPEIAGGYVLDRYLCTALRYTIEKGGDPREILLDWNKKINVENKIRRKEFGLLQEGLAG